MGSGAEERRGEERIHSSRRVALRYSFSIRSDRSVPEARGNQEEERGNLQRKANIERSAPLQRGARCTRQSFIVEYCLMITGKVANARFATNGIIKEMLSSTSTDTKSQ